MPDVNVNALRAAVARPVPALEPDGPADVLARIMRPSYDHARAVQEGTASPYGTSNARGRRSRLAGAGADASTAARCGDCRAIRSPLASVPCGSCGSTQPPLLSAMNPRAARMIGQQGYR